MYNIQGVAPKKHKEASVHRLLMLLAVPDIQELHSNLKILLEELGLDMLDFVVTSDIKISPEHTLLHHKHGFLIKFYCCWERTLVLVAMLAPTARTASRGTPPASSTH